MPTGKPHFPTPCAPRLDPLRSALAKLDPAQIANDSLSRTGQNASKNGQAPKTAPLPKASPPAKADKRARSVKALKISPGFKLGRLPPDR